MSSVHKILSCGALVAMTLVFAGVGCGGAGDSAEGIGTVDEALNEYMCAIVTADVTGGSPGTAYGSFGTGYGHGANCPLQNVVEYNVSANKYRANDGWSNRGTGNWRGGGGGCGDYGNGITQAVCGTAYVTLGIYGHPSGGGAWDVLNTPYGYYAYGHWVADQPTGGCFGGDLPAHCSWLLVGGGSTYTNPDVIDNLAGTYDKIRLAARGMTVVGGVITQQSINVELDEVPLLY